MTLEQYEALKLERQRTAWQPRPSCLQCRKPVVTCYCDTLRPFHSRPEFVILIHRMEAFRKIATGRMAHQCLANSSLFVGTDYSEDEAVNAIIEDPTVYPVLLYPSKNAVNLSELAPTARQELFPSSKRLVVFVLDATWAQAKRMRRLSRNLLSLPAICFTPTTASRFRVRQQPKAICYSTIESIHLVMELLQENHQERGSLLSVFDQMVERQIAYGHLKSHRRGIRLADRQ